MKHADQVLNGDLGPLKLCHLRDAWNVGASASKVNPAPSKHLAIPPDFVAVLIEPNFVGQFLTLAARVVGYCHAWLRRLPCTNSTPTAPAPFRPRGVNLAPSSVRFGGAVKRLLPVCLALFIGACNTVPNQSPPPISVPSGLNANAVELAVLMAVVDAKGPPQLTVGQQITDNVLSAVLGGYGSLQRRNAWYYEGREPGVVYAGFQHRGHYMKVAVGYSAQDVRLAIVESRNLKQSDSRIHKTAMKYLQSLEDRLRRSLGMVAQQQLLGPQPAATKPHKAT